MSSDKAIARGVEACSSNTETMSKTTPNTQEKPGSSLAKALAQRAVSGSRHDHRQVKGRKLAESGVKFSPSRLSKVSLSKDSVK